MEKAIEPVGHHCDDFEILTQLSRHLGVEEQFTEGRTVNWQGIFIGHANKCVRMAISYLPTPTSAK